jgi:predicted ATPase
MNSFPRTARIAMQRPSDGAPTSSTSVIVGRERERSLLRGALDAARVGCGSLALLGGEAGIGKTTLVEDLAAQASIAGVSVLRGGCYDLTTTPPYGPWAEAAQAAQLLPGAVPLPPGLQPGGNAQLDSQAELFEQVTGFLLALAGARPLLHVL